MFRYVNFFCLAAILLIGSALPARAVDNPIEAKVSKNKVATGELFSYTLKIKGGFSSPKLTLPKFNEFKVVSTNQAKNYSLQGGSAKIELVINCVLVATKPGIFTIKEAILEDTQKKFSTAPIPIEVTGKPLEEKRKVLPYMENGTEI